MNVLTAVCRYHAGFHLVCIIAGAGTLAFPSTMAYMGWGPGMVAWTLIAIAGES